MATNPPELTQMGERSRLSLELSPAVSLLLDHIATVTGSPKSQIVNQALFDALPLLLDRVDALAKRSQALSQSIAQAQKGGKR